MTSTATRAALVTGGSSGIGLAVARVLGEEGYALTISARGAERLEAAAQDLRDSGFDVSVTPADLAEEDDVIALFKAHRERFGRLDALVNSAGVGTQGSIEEIDAGSLDAQIGLNLRALIVATREGMPMLREAGGEHGKALLVNIASLAGKGGQAGAAVYSATKAAVINFTACAGVEAGAAGVQCTSLSPGFTDTPMTDPVKGKILGDTMIRPGDIGEAVRFLLRTSPNCQVPELVFTRPGLAVGH